MTDSLTDLLAAIVRGDRRAATALATLDPDDVRKAAERHGVLPLVAERFAAWDIVSDPLRSSFVEEAHRRAAADVLRGYELTQALGELSQHGVPLIVMKGAQLAYSHYERPDLRPRLDTDILVPVEARGRVGDALERCGYTAAPQLPGELVMYQLIYTKRRGSMSIHTLDVHWRIANPQVFGAVLSFEELASTAVLVPNLAPGARGLSHPYALLLACVHRVAHHFDADYLIWLYDIHLIAARLSEEAWTQFVGIARERGVATICLRGLERTLRYFPTGIPARVLAELLESPRTSAEAATAAYLTPGRRHVENVLSDVRALPTWSARIRLMLQHLFPSPQYMREVYAASSAVPLPLLYVKRAVHGARKWLVHSS